MTQSTAESPPATDSADRDSAGRAKPTDDAARPDWWLRGLGRAVDKKITSLQDEYIAKSPAARAELARLRRGLGKTAGSVPDIWELTVGLVPRDMVWDGDEPSRAEQAVHAAMTLYALHQQSQDIEMHKPGVRLGTAVRRLAAGDGTKSSQKESKEGGGKDRKEDGRKQAVTRRFMAVATAQSIDEVLFHVRGLIGQLRREEQPLDYAMFAEDVLKLLTPGRENQVRLAWGRDYYRTPSAKPADKDGEAPDATSPTDDNNE
jgi:CRISPR system Cascade subunit CasB